MTRHRSPPSFFYAPATLWTKSAAVMVDADVATVFAQRWRTAQIVPVAVAGTRRRRDAR